MEIVTFIVGAIVAAARRITGVFGKGRVPRGHGLILLAERRWRITVGG